MWKRKWWKRKHFDERGWKQKQTRKRKFWKGAGSVRNFFKIRCFRIFKLATTVGVKCNKNNNSIKSTARAWCGMEWKMEWNGNFCMDYGRCQNEMELKISRMEWKTIFYISIPVHIRFCTLYLQKNTYRCRVVINNIGTEVFNFNIYAYYLSTNRGTLVVYIAQTVYVMHRWKYIAICSIHDIVGDFDRFHFFFFFEIDNLPSPKFCFFTWSRKLVFAISFPFQLNFS